MNALSGYRTYLAVWLPCLALWSAVAGLYDASAALGLGKALAQHMDADMQQTMEAVVAVLNGPLTTAAALASTVTALAFTFLRLGVKNAAMPVAPVAAPASATAWPDRRGSGTVSALILVASFAFAASSCVAPETRAAARAIERDLGVLLDHAVAKPLNAAERELILKRLPAAATAAEKEAALVKAYNDKQAQLEQAGTLIRDNARRVREGLE